MYSFVGTFVRPVQPAKLQAFDGRSRSFRLVFTRRVATPRMILSTEDETAIRITGNNITITESLRDYVKEKLSKVIRKYNSLLTKIDVHLVVEHNPAIQAKHKAEVVAFAGRTILRSEIRDEDMYAAIDLVEEKISRTIRKFKERKNSKKSTKNAAPDISEVAATPDFETPVSSEEDDGLEDVYADKVSLVPPVNEIVKRKVFPMPLQTVEEAVLCCEYVDHPWYLFRNAETKEICLVYKRNHGGYGLIEPSNPNAVADE